MPVTYINPQKISSVLEVSQTLNDSISSLQQYLSTTNSILSTLQNTYNAAYNYSVTNLSNATSDYNLEINQTAIISFTNITSVPLHIATTDGTYYSMHIVCSNAVNSTGTNSPIILEANNQLYSNKFMNIYHYLEYNSGTLISGTSVSNPQSGFYLAVSFGSIVSYITNHTVYKNVRGFADINGISGAPYLWEFNTDWWDTTTSWTSLGTIVFPQATSGVIVIQRIM